MLIPAAAGVSPLGKIELYSAKYYAACTLGGIVACGLTHAAVTPLDLVKCRRQVDPNMYKGNLEGFSKIYRAEGLRGNFTGWGPTLVGYSFQGKSLSPIPLPPPPCVPLCVFPFVKGL